MNAVQPSRAVPRQVPVWALCLWLLLGAHPGRAQHKPTTKEEKPGKSCYLFASFRKDGEDGLHLCWSNNAYTWYSLKNDQSFLVPAVGEQKIMRDPCLYQGPDGTFHLVWTTAWRGQTIGYSSSKDLVHWTEQVALPVMADEPDCMYAWAPEIRYDATQKDYLIYWSSALKSEQRPDSTGKLRHYARTYAVHTRDFKRFSKPTLFFNPGHAQIDASLLADHGKYLLFFKYAYRGIAYAVADNFNGPWRETQPPFTNDDWEGPWPMKVGKDYLVYIDNFKSKSRMGAWRSSDLLHWTDVSAEIHFPVEQLHGSVLPVSGKLVQLLLQQSL
ncbi:glycoside hydrolase family 43 protein [Hymenobacter jejuensis]|uniref:Glycosyl hydrolase n=1 Tax=Hymenobacter jejuensis TaxID=2502781 RepID=A0A5B8A5X2_9BACT|nr:glycoside hydrolase family 43 protein [Hymenobacter jejuensis]QDA61632.1 glycosyl hydrolase [Hymenobacter jejuensis]